MEEILHQLLGSLSHYWQGFIHPRWLAGFLPSTVYDPLLAENSLHRVERDEINIRFSTQKGIGSFPSVAFVHPPFNKKNTEGCVHLSNFILQTDSSSNWHHLTTKKNTKAYPRGCNKRAFASSRVHFCLAVLTKKGSEWQNETQAFSPKKMGHLVF